MGSRSVLNPRASAMAVAGPREHAVIKLYCNILRRGERRRKLFQEKQIQMSDRQGRKKTRKVHGEYLVSCKLN